MAVSCRVSVDQGLFREFVHEREPLLCSVASHWVATPGGYRLGAAGSPLGTAPSYDSGGTTLRGPGC